MGIEFESIDDGRALEIEAVEQGRPSSEFCTSPFSDSEMFEGDDSPVGLIQADYVVETDEYRQLLPPFVAHMVEAYAQRGLTYPFQISPAGDRLVVKPGMDALAAECARLASLRSKGGRDAKKFEIRAAKALAVLIGGWHANVGSPWSGRLSTKTAIQKFRSYLNAVEVGPYSRQHYRGTRGDIMVDSFGILGRAWGGPLVVMQCKNSGWDIEKFACEMVQVGKAVKEWFGREVHHRRGIVKVCAVNSVLTIGDKEEVYSDTAGGGPHIIDVADILLAESLTGSSPSSQNCGWLCL